MSDDRDSLGGILFTAALTHAIVRYPAVYWMVLVLLLPLYAAITWRCLEEAGFLHGVGWVLLVGGVLRYGGGMLYLTIACYQGIGRLARGNALGKLVAAMLLMAACYGALTLAQVFVPIVWPSLAGNLHLGE